MNRAVSEAVKSMNVLVVASSVAMPGSEKEVQRMPIAAMGNLPGERITLPAKSFSSSISTTYSSDSETIGW